MKALSQPGWVHTWGRWGVGDGGGGGGEVLSLICGHMILKIIKKPHILNKLLYKDGCGVEYGRTSPVCAEH